MMGVACGDDSATNWSARAISESTEGAVAQPILVNSSVAVGRNRLTFGLFDDQGGLLSEAAVNLRLYRLEGDPGATAGASLISEHQLSPVSLAQPGVVHVHSDGSRHIHSVDPTTVFVTYAEFSESGWWGAELTVEALGILSDGLRMRLWVSDNLDELMPGDIVPRSTQSVLRDVDDITEIDSMDPPNPELHRLTVAEAIDMRRPMVVAFATPMFCQTRFCGPLIQEIVIPMHELYGDRAQFIHIEPFDIGEARKGRLVPVSQMSEWALTTEPWIFVIDDSGILVEKFEGIMSLDEVSNALVPLLGIVE